MSDNINSQINIVQKAINMCIEKGLKKSARIIKKKTKEANRSAVNKLVYNKYTPIVYKRRKTNGGLADSHNITFDEPTFKNDFVLTTMILEFHNITKPSPFHNVKNNGKTNINKNYTTFYNNSCLSDMIQNGYGNRQYAWNKPRPFMYIDSNIQDEKLKKWNIKDNVENSEFIKQQVYDNIKYELENLFGFGSVKKNKT